MKLTIEIIQKIIDRGLVVYGITHGEAIKPSSVWRTPSGFELKDELGDIYSNFHVSLSCWEASVRESSYQFEKARKEYERELCSHKGCVHNRDNDEQRIMALLDMS